MLNSVKKQARLEINYTTGEVTSRLANRLTNYWSIPYFGANRNMGNDLRFVTFGILSAL